MSEEKQQQQQAQQQAQSQNESFANLQNMLLQNLEINRQNTDEIKDSVKAAQDLERPFNLSSEAAREIMKVSRASSSINATINSQLEERNSFLRGSKTIKKDLAKADNIGNSLQNERAEIQKKQMAASKAGKDDEAELYAEINRGLQAQISQTNDIEANLKAELEHAENIENAFGLTGKSLGLIDKLTGGQIGDLGEIEKATTKRLAALEEQGKLEDGLGGKMQGFGIQIHEVGKSIMKNMTDPLVILQQLMNFSNQTRDLQRGLGISGKEACLITEVH